MPYKEITPEIREKQREYSRQWRLNNPDKIKLQHQRQSRSPEGYQREKLRKLHNYEFYKEFRSFRQAVPAFLTV